MRKKNFFFFWPKFLRVTRKAKMKKVVSKVSNYFQLFFLRAFKYFIYIYCKRVGEQ